MGVYQAGQSCRNRPVGLASLPQLDIEEPIPLNGKKKVTDDQAGELTLEATQTLRPLRPPGRLVPSCGIGVTSSIRPIRKPALASIRIAACAPGPGVRALCPPGALTLMCNDVMPLSFATRAAAAAACIAAYGDPCNRSAFTCWPPALREIVSAPLRSVIWTSVLLNEE